MTELKTRIREIDHEIGRRIYQARIALSLTIKELAKEIGVTGQQFSKYEKAENRVPISRLIILAKKLDKDINYFLTDNAELDKVTREDKRSLIDKRITLKLQDKVSKLTDIAIKEALYVLVEGLIV